MTLHILDHISDDLYAEIEAFSNCTLYHTQHWHHFLAQALGWRVRAALERDETGRLLWLLPFITRRRTRPKAVHVCLPLSHQVGIVGQVEESRSLTELLAPMEIHSPVPLSGASQHQKNVITVLDMAACKDENTLRQRFHKDSIQRKIQKAEKSGLRSVIATTLEQVEIFEHLQTETRWRQGSPTYPKGFFRKQWQSLDRNQFRLHLVYQDQRIVSGILFLHFRDTAIYGYGASVNDRAVWQLGANQLAMWSAIRDAYQSGKRWVDFGTSPLGQPELQAYKEKWGGISQPLYYTYVGMGGKVGGVQRDSKMVKWVGQMLSRMPLPLFAQVSPLLFRRVV